MIKLFCDRNLLDATIETIGSIKQKDNIRHIVFTPDRMNQNIQNVIFDVLGSKALFDVDVTTLSRFVNSNLERLNVTSLVLSNLGGVAIVKDIIEKNKDILSTFISSKISAQVVYDTICQLKSCNITPDSLVEENLSPILASKLGDISLIYTKYEEYLQGEFVDSFNRLHLFAKEINKLDFSNTYFYFVGFEDFTNLQLEVIFALERYSAGVSCATLVGENSICPNFVLGNIEYYAKVYGVKIAKFDCKHYLSSESEYLFDNYGKNVSRVATNNIAVYSASTICDEVEFVARNIAKNIMNGGRYRDYCILCADMEKYYETVDKTFREYNIPNFIDIVIDNSRVCAFKFLRVLLDAIDSDFDYTSFMALISNKYLGLDRDIICDIDNKCIEIGIKYDLINSKILQNEFPQVFAKLENISKFVNYNGHTYSEFNDSFRQLLDSICFFDNVSYYEDYFKSIGDYNMSRALGQVESKIGNVLSEIELVVGDVEVTFDGYIDMIGEMLSTISISLPPTLVDSVFVGDITSSYILPYSHLIVLGACDSALPRVFGDMGIISDTDIEHLSYGHRITPTIDMTNKRFRYHAISMMMMFSESLKILYHTKSDSGVNLHQSTIVDNILSLFDAKQENISSTLYLYNSKQAVINNNLNLPAIRHNYVRGRVSTGSVEQKSVANTLKVLLEDFAEIIDTKIDSGAESKLSTTSGLYFRSSGSVSEIENYSSCPYMHFLNYGLRLREQKTSKIDVRILGTIVHEFAQKFVRNIINLQSQNLDINSIAIKTLSEILKSDEYKNFVESNENISALVSLKDEVVRLANALYDGLQVSDFKPSAELLEYKFKGENAIDIDTKYGTIRIEGIIDRIDVCDNSFRIIDYKTGSDTFSYTDIASGKKLQLLVYLKAYKDLSGFRPVGAFYMPIKNNYKSVDTASLLYSLDGIITNIVSDAIKQDHTLGSGVRGKYLKFKLKNDGSFDGNTGRGRILSAEQLDRLLDFVMDKMRNAVENILDGDISHSPLQDGKNLYCEHCKYIGMCPKCDPKVYKSTSKVEEVLNGNE